MTRGRFDVLVVGAGAVGLTAALAFRRAGFVTGLVGRPATRRDGRTAALLDRSLRFLDRLDLRRAIESAGSPLRTMRIVDDTDNLFRPPPVSFRAAELGLPAFGFNIENASLLMLLAEAVRAEPGLTWHEAMVTGSGGAKTGQVELDDGSSLEGALLVAADGRDSRLRDAVGIAARRWTYPQHALTTILAHDAPHGDASTEFHTRTGPFTLVPLPGMRSSLVWAMSPALANRVGSLDDAALARTVGERASLVLGRVAIDGPRGIVPLGGLSVAHPWSGRVALLGEAAHVLPPIGAQGLNLGMADVEALVTAASADGSGDPGAASALERYADLRERETRMRSFAVDGLNRALLTKAAPIDALRGVGLAALARIGPLRRAVMRAGLGPSPAEQPVSAFPSRAASRPFP